jgi:hypothetical protein
MLCWRRDRPDLLLQFSYKVIATRIRVFDEGVIDFVDKWGRPSGILKEGLTGGKLR